MQADLNGTAASGDTPATQGLIADQVDFEVQQRATEKAMGTLLANYEKLGKTLEQNSEARHVNTEIRYGNNTEGYLTIGSDKVKTRLKNCY